MSPLPGTVWSALLDDEAPLTAPGAAGPEGRSSAHAAVRAVVVRDLDLPLLHGSARPLHVVVTGGAGQVAGPVALCARLGLRLVGLDIVLRDRDDLAGNARRVVAAVRAARDAGSLADDVPVHVELPPDEPTHGWLAAADEVAAAELRLTLRTPGAPTTLLASWIDVALDRETPFRCTAGLSPLQVLVATRLALDGATPDVVAATLGASDAALSATDLGSVRRWVTSVGTPDVEGSLAELRKLGLGVDP